MRSEPLTAAAGDGVAATSVSIDPPHRLAVRVRRSLLPSLLGATLDALGGRPVGLAPGWRSAIRRAATDRDATVTFPMARPRHPVLPQSLVDLSEDATDPRAVFARLRDLPADTLATDLASEPPDLLRHWRGALKAPGRWRDDLVDLLEHVWGEVYSHAWRRAAGGLAREADAIARAAVCSTVELLVDRSHADLAAAPGTLVITRGRSRTVDATERPLVILPLAVGSRSLLSNVTGGTEVLLGYTPPAVRAALAGSRHAAGAGRDDLDELLGHARARVVRALDRPMPAGELAERGSLAPSSLSYHLNRLERAGLLVRERSGPQVVVRLTDRGLGLVDLYS